MIFLRKASGIGFYTETKVTTLEFKKNAVMLTGHNGSGKTSFLLGLYNTISSINERHPQTLALMGNRSWGFEIELEDDQFYEKYKTEFLKLFIPKTQLKINVRHIVCDRNKSMLDQNKLRTFIETDPLTKGLKESFIDFKNKISNSDKEFDGNYYSLPKDENDSVEVDMMKLVFLNDHRTTSIQEEYRDELKNNKEFLPCVLLINEQIYANTSNNEPTSLKIYNNEANNLDKTTYLVLNRLSKEILKGNRDYKYKLDEIFSNNNNDIKKIKLDIEKLLSEQTHTKEIQDLISKLNKFFNPTGKSAHISEDGFLYLKENNSTINWYQCSKGEKNLIVLIVLAYLNKSKNTIFILDEPDLSMHIEWQELLLPTLIDLCPNNQFFISTHSPSLIPDYRDNIQFFNMNKIKKDAVDHG
ncbi:AAA family ATPase [Acinetobacter oleivorans]|uniref:AAA family ATPase n=1 Tax=Acinetobacter oleivorans TaxID=1148157 RepID=UPI003A877DEF